MLKFVHQSYTARVGGDKTWPKNISFFDGALSPQKPYGLLGTGEGHLRVGIFMDTSVGLNVVKGTTSGEYSTACGSYHYTKCDRSRLCMTVFVSTCKAIFLWLSIGLQIFLSEV